MPTLSKSYELCKFSCVGSIRGIPSGRGWAHHARSGSQSEHRIHFILPTCAASYLIKWLVSKISTDQSYAIPFHDHRSWHVTFFPRKSQIEPLSYTNQHMMVSWRSNEPFIFSFSPLWRVHQFPNRNIGKTYILQLIPSLYFIFCLHLFSPPWEEKINK